MNPQIYNITISPAGLPGSSAQTYVKQVTEHLSWIERTKSGKILLNSIKFYNKPVTIQPYTVGNCNATASTPSVGGAFGGTVNYSPSTFSRGGACPARSTHSNRGLFWDEILFHELVHIFRFVSGKFKASPLNFGMAQYTNTEEFIAVLVTNIYISDRSNKIKSGLRAAHTGPDMGFTPLSTSFDEGFELFSQSRHVYRIIDQFCQENKGLTLRLANDLASAAFNPIADYYANRERARQLSERAPYTNDVGGLLDDLAQAANRVLN